MNDRQIDDLLFPPDPEDGMDAAAVARLAQSLIPAGPVKPLPPRRVLSLGFAAICAAIGVGFAAPIGMAGIARLGGARAGCIFFVLAVLVWLGAWVCTAEMIPGTRRALSPAGVLGVAVVALLATFWFVFSVQQELDFVPSGLRCLKAGVLCAVPAAVAGWLLIRRGFLVSPMAAALSVGSLAGLAGVVMLELHCPNFGLFHVMVWHVGVLGITGIAGLLGYIVMNRTKTRHSSQL